MHLISRLFHRYRHLVPELSKFGVVGVMGLLVDVGGFNLLRYGVGGTGPLHEYPLSAKVISSALATVVAWLAHRYWTYAHARRSAAHHEFLLFVVACTLGTFIAVGCLAVSHYVLDLTSAFADNVSANVVGLGLATLFRFWAYRTHVFSEPEPEEVVSAAATDLPGPQPHLEEQADHLEAEGDRLAEVPGH